MSNIDPLGLQYVPANFHVCTPILILSLNFDISNWTTTFIIKDEQGPYVAIYTLPKGPGTNAS